MLVDTHCHLNMMLKELDDALLTQEEIVTAKSIIERATKAGVNHLINVGTNIPESINCIELARHYPHVYAVIGIHPNDATDNWKTEFKKLCALARDHEKLKIVGIGECGIDKHYKDYNLVRQQDVFKAQIELALEYDLGLVIHSRDAPDETLQAICQYDGQLRRAVMHCFSYDQSIASEITNRGLLLGIGGTVTYPKNATLRSVVLNTNIDTIVLETDAPFLPPQQWRGKQNSPEHIKTIAEFIAQLKELSFEKVAETTTANALKLFNLTAKNVNQ